MSPLEPLAPDQRAVVALVLQQGRSYDEIATLLGIPVDAVRARAHAGLAALVPGNGLPGEITAPLADYLLGQQAASDAEATRGLLAESAPAREWAAGVADRLEDVAPRGLPEVPGAEAAEAPPAAPDEAAAPGAPPPASRLGGALLIGAAVLAVGVVLFLVLRGGSDDEEPGSTGAAAPTATATATPTATATATVTDQIRLRAAAGGKAKGTMTVFLQGGRLGFALQATGVPRSGDGDAYAVWFTGPGDRAVRLGFTSPVAANGRLGIQGPSETGAKAFPRQYASYENVVVSRETNQDATRPAAVLMRGSLPRGR
jgi:hypothetical protein